MDEKILEELTLMRKELQNIRIILQSRFVDDYTVERQIVDGKILDFFNFYYTWKDRDRNIMSAFFNICHHRRPPVF